MFWHTIFWRFLGLGFTGILLTVASCSNNDDSFNPPPDDSQLGVDGQYELVPAYPNLSFTRPVDYQHAGDGSNRVFVVEQRGVITVFDDDGTTSQSTTFLDISGPVDDNSNEEGLLGLAFHPNYASNGFFYVNYTVSNPARTRISRFSVSAANPTAADPDSEQILLEFGQPFGNHNGGQLGFGPDGYLYIAVGDGGSAGDPEENGQDLTTLLGSILRIDVDQSANNLPYAIPADNPFAGNDQDIREEIFAYGLRNPWRFSFDTQTGQLWTGDVGQNAMEEINIIENGGNYGWNTTEGNLCFDPANNCNTEGITLPILTYRHNQGDRSVTGGFVYRGTEQTELAGYYIYADFVSGRVWAADVSDLSSPSITQLVDSNLGISSFGVNGDQELFVCAFDGQIYRLNQVATPN
ncbi:MAG: PQQ-dependent sugar dehydrogenase [Bacteroidota bacterium]